MKQLVSFLVVAVFAFSFSACDLLDSNPDRDTDSEIIIPDDSPSDDDSGKDNGGNTGDNGGSTGDNGDGTEDNGDGTEDNTDDRNSQRM